MKDTGWNDATIDALLHYGNMLYDHETLERSGFLRFNVFNYEGKLYIVLRLNGEIIEIKQIKFEGDTDGNQNEKQYESVCNLL